MLSFIGSKLKDIRIGCDLSLGEAERLTGVPVSTLSDLELGKKKKPRKDTVLKICQGFHIMPEFFYVDRKELGFGEVVAHGMLGAFSPAQMKFLLDPYSLAHLEVAVIMREKGIPIEVMLPIAYRWGESNKWRGPHFTKEKHRESPEDGGIDEVPKEVPLWDRELDKDPYIDMALKLKEVGIPVEAVMQFWRFVVEQQDVVIGAISHANETKKMMKSPT